MEAAASERGLEPQVSFQEIEGPGSSLRGLMKGGVLGRRVFEALFGPAPPEPEATLYTVQSGDSLSKIAKAHYGDASKYMIIFEANQPLLKDPNKIYPGQALRIPPVA